MALVEGEEREDQSLQIPAGTLPSDVFEEATREIKKPEQELEQEQEKKEKKRGNQDPGPPPPPPEGHSAPYISTKGGARVWFCESQDKKHQKVYEGGRWKEVEPEDSKYQYSQRKDLC